MPHFWSGGFVSFFAVLTLLTIVPAIMILAIVPFGPALLMSFDAGDLIVPLAITNRLGPLISPGLPW